MSQIIAIMIWGIKVQRRLVEKLKDIPMGTMDTTLMIQEILVVLEDMVIA